MGLEIGFTGTRAGMTSAQRSALSIILEAAKPFKFRHGGCIGADEQAHAICRTYAEKTYIVEHPSDLPHTWMTHKHQAKIIRPPDYTCESLPPLTRNKEIVRLSHLIIAAPKSLKEELRSGTWATIRHARKVGKPVIVLDPGGVKI